MLYQLSYTPRPARWLIQQGTEIKGVVRGAAR